MKMTKIDNRWGSLHLVLDSVGELPVLRCDGRIVTGMETAALSAVVQSQFRCDLILDLSGVSAVDAGGLGTLVGLHRWAEGRGRRLTLVNPSKRVRMVMERTGLSSLLETCCVPPQSLHPFELQRCTA